MLKRIWWKTRKNIMPFGGMIVRWKGHRFLLFLDDPTCRWMWINQFRVFEEFEFLSSRLLREGDIVLDIGAHYGYTATIFSAAVGRNGMVLAIEAAPHTVSRLRRQLTLTGQNNVQVVPCAVGVCSEIRTMHVSFEGHQDYQCLELGKSGSMVYTEYVPEEILVQVRPLNMIIESFNDCEPTLVKIDIEGGELPALQGASHVLQRANPPWLFVEIHRAAQEKNGFLCNQLLDFIKQYSQSFYIFDEMENFVVLSPAQMNDQIEHAEYFNILVRPPRGRYSQRQI